MLVALGALSLAGAVLVGASLVAGLARLPRLSDAGAPGRTPLVTIVVAARDEADTIGEALPSLLSQDYPVEVVVVDDRSTDGTGLFLDRFVKDAASLRVEHIRDLPPGWLGKNHALQRGAELARGELLLFTDADVVMQPDAVGRAVAVLEELGLDHLAVSPRLYTRSRWATMALSVFLGLFASVYRPWKAVDPNSRFHVGIGAFNLVRAEAYHRIGGHEAVALRPDDDVQLGQALKRSGARQAAATGPDHVSVEWYRTLPEMARGLRKNAFAVVDYRLSVVVASTVIPVLLVFWPLVALFLTDGLVWWLNAGALAAGMATAALIAHPPGLPLWVGLTYPIGSALLVWIVWAAAVRAVRTGEIEWRGTRYPLAELRSPPLRRAAAERRTLEQQQRRDEDKSAAE